MNIPERNTLYHLEVVLTPQGDIRCLGRVLGRLQDFSTVLTLQKEDEAVTPAPPPMTDKTDEA